MYSLVMLRLPAARQFGPGGTDVVYVCCLWHTTDALFFTAGVSVDSASLLIRVNLFIHRSDSSSNVHVCRLHHDDHLPVHVKRTREVLERCSLISHVYNSC